MLNTKQVIIRHGRALLVLILSTCFSFQAIAFECDKDNNKDDKNCTGKVVRGPINFTPANEQVAKSVKKRKPPVDIPVPPTIASPESSK